jgi:hypothetical protein
MSQNSILHATFTSSIIQKNVLIIVRENEDYKMSRLHYKFI